MNFTESLNETVKKDEGSSDSAVTDEDMPCLNLLILYISIISLMIVNLWYNGVERIRQGP